jgi:hypothetical protein
MSIFPCLILRNVQFAVNSSSLNKIFNYLDYLFIYVMVQLSNDQLQRQQKYIEKTDNKQTNQNKYRKKSVKVLLE